MVEPVRLLYVGGVPRSGSTLADLMIGQLPGHVGVGELYYLWTSHRSVWRRHTGNLS